jgi:hypothetical protein
MKILGFGNERFGTVNQPQTVHEEHGRRDLAECEDAGNVESPRAIVNANPTIRTKHLLLLVLPKVGIKG